MSALSRVLGCRWASAATAIVLSSALLVPGAPAAAAAPTPAGANVPCADVMPLASVAAGQVGTGWTVVRGQVPKPFRVRILGVYPDGVAPGKDMIMMEVSDLPDRNVVAAGGGIWAGMSGSPVYIGGQLVGAVAYGFSVGPSRIGGLSPAEDMARLLSYPTPSSAAAVAARPTRTHLSAPVRRELSRLTGASVAASGDFDRLPLPLAVSGVPARGRQLLSDRLQKAGLPSLVTRGSATPAPSGGFATPIPGGNFAALIAYGDVTVGGVGTTTWVCGSRALAFGHPLALTGRSAFGASGARSLAIVTDPTAGPFKLAIIGAPFGIVDQDRLSGIRASLGESPLLLPVVARIRDVDLGVTRTGRTDVTASDWVPFVAPQHVFADMIAVTDREGPGTAAVRYEIDGRRANGEPWSLVVTDRLVSTSDIQIEPAFALDMLLYRLANNGVEAVTFSRVRTVATVREDVAISSITRVRISRNGGAFAERDRMRVAPGDQLALRVSLRGRDGTIRIVPLAVQVPADASGFGLLEVAGGASRFSACDIDPSSCPTLTFKRLLRSIAAEPRSDDLLLNLAFEGPEGPVGGVSVRDRQPEVVSGLVGIQLTVR